MVLWPFLWYQDDADGSLAGHIYYLNIIWNEYQILVPHHQLNPFSFISQEHMHPPMYIPLNKSTSILKKGENVSSSELTA